MGPGPIGPPPGARDFEYDKVERPHTFRDLPRFLGKVIGGFFSRLFYIFRLVWETNPAILFLLSFVALFEGVMPVVTAVVSSDILNELQINLGVGGNLASYLASGLFFLLIFLFVLRIVSAIVSRVSNAVTRIAGERVVKHVRMKIMHKAEELDTAAYDSPLFYEKLENANREAGMRPIQILSSTFSMVSTVISLVSYIVILFRAPGMWWSSLVIIATAIPTAIINFSYRKKNFQYMRRKSKERRQMNYYADLMVNKDMVKEVRMYDLGDTFIQSYDSAFDRYYKGLRRMILSESYWHVGTAVFSSVVNCLFFAMIAYKVFQGELMIGDYSLLTGALMSIAGNVTTLITISATIYEGTLFIDNLLSFLKERQTIVPHVNPPLPVAHGTQHVIEFQHVTFRYPGVDHDVLHDINMTLRPGESLVLVGLNGAGKTTLLKLLTRLYDPTGGRILLDGKDLRDYDVKDLYRMFGIIFQDFGKYAESVENNIHFGDIHKEMNDREIREAAEASGASDFIEKLPAGYSTPLMRIFEPNGLELSGGQWQKLAISRAFYSDSDVLILDEPTASLDAIAEQEIYNQFDRLRQGKTTIFVSHRLSSATTASKIVVLEYGTIIEEGTHHELMERHGRYYELFSTQAKRYKEE